MGQRGICIRNMCVLHDMPNDCSSTGGFQVAHRTKEPYLKVFFLTGSKFLRNLNENKYDIFEYEYDDNLYTFF